MTDIQYKSFRHRVQVYSDTDTPDSYGGFTTTRTLTASVWAHVQKQSSSTVFGLEKMRAGQMSSEAQLIITMWYTPLVTPKSVLTWNGHTYDVTDAVDVDYEHKYLQVYCIERKGS